MWAGQVSCKDSWWGRRWGEVALLRGAFSLSLLSIGNKSSLAGTSTNWWRKQSELQSMRHYNGFCNIFIVFSMKWKVKPAIMLYWHKTQITASVHLRNVWSIFSESSAFSGWQQHLPHSSPLSSQLGRRSFFAVRAQNLPWSSEQEAIDIKSKVLNFVFSQ